MIFDLLNLTDKKLCNKADLLGILDTIKPEVLLTIGAGDIDQLCEPIVKYLDEHVA